MAASQPASVNLHMCVLCVVQWNWMRILSKSFSLRSWKEKLQAEREPPPEKQTTPIPHLFCFNKAPHKLPLSASPDTCQSAPHLHHLRPSSPLFTHTYSCTYTTSSTNIITDARTSIFCKSPKITMHECKKGWSGVINTASYANFINAELQSHYANEGVSSSLLTNTPSSSHPAARMDDKSAHSVYTGGMPMCVLVWLAD